MPPARSKADPFKTELVAGRTHGGTTRGLDGSGALHRSSGLHFTSQHQWKVQEQRSTTVTSCVRWPRPQHIRSHPSTPIEVSLHWRPCVPWMPRRGLRSQKPGEGSR
uniref:Uncharacterized protein n=1 Tax=Anopheles atroparvus TaxID=41427 RepID=A0A182J3E3_ANOAO